MKESRDMNGAAVCNHCGSALAPGDRFCGECGRPASVVEACPVCETRHEREGRFCGTCGAPRDPAATPPPAAASDPPADPEATAPSVVSKPHAEPERAAPAAASDPAEETARTAPAGVSETPAEPAVAPAPSSSGRLLIVGVLVIFAVIVGGALYVYMFHFDRTPSAGDDEPFVPSPPAFIPTTEKGGFTRSQPEEESTAPAEELPELLLEEIIREIEAEGGTVTMDDITIIDAE